VTLRIIAGSWKGRRLEAPAGLGTRPLPDRIKQSLFDWLGQDLSGMSIADVCSGSGSFAFEAASRGAHIVHACEPSPHAFATLAANHATLGRPSSVMLHRAPFEAVLPSLSGLDLVFADPPFPWYVDDPRRVADLITLAAKTLTASGSLLIRGESGSLLPAVTGIRENERRQYGRSWIAKLQSFNA
jgi:16S rRNA (guanine966-N2)-methyltransferase